MALLLITTSWQLYYLSVDDVLEVDTSVLTLFYDDNTSYTSFGKK